MKAKRFHAIAICPKCGREVIEVILDPREARWLCVEHGRMESAAKAWFDAKSGKITRVKSASLMR